MQAYTLFRDLAFRLPAEPAHEFGLFALKKALQLGWENAEARKLLNNEPVEIAGLLFYGRLGLAAGLDKNAYIGRMWQKLGFGFAEIGTLTPKPQEGNPQPRLYRLKTDEAIINRMGFNNIGLEAATKRLEKQKRNTGFILGGNLGKNKSTPLEEAALDYQKGMQALCKHVDYFTINISSPNTPGLRDLQEKKAIRELLETLVPFSKNLENPRPIFVKIAPDLDPESLEQLCKVIRDSGADGIVATNTTISREGLKTSKEQVESIGAGGLSGKPLFKKSLEMVARTRKITGPNFPLIGAGGIFSGKDAVTMREAGADLVQVFTGFIYRGPMLIEEINRELRQKEPIE